VRRHLPTLLAVIVLFGSVACASRPAPAERLSIAVSFPLLADLVGQVVGERGDVWSIVPVGADPHTYEATPRDVARVTRSAALLYVGASNERFLESGAFRQAASEAGVMQLEYAKAIDLIVRDVVIDHGDHVHDLRQGDPHFWLDPHKVVEMLEPTLRLLRDIDPGGSVDYRRNADRLRERLLALDASLRSSFARIPADKRKLVVFHDAYAYFAARYHFTVVAHVLKQPGVEPTAREIAELHDLIRRERLTVAFKEPQFSARVLERVAADLGITVAELFTDTFTDSVTDYFALMRANERAIVTHLR